MHTKTHRIVRQERLQRTLPGTRRRARMVITYLSGSQKEMM